MFFANPWGLLGLLSLPAIVAVHLFQRRFPPLKVAGLHLWGVEVEAREAGRNRDRLPVTLTLILELLAALLLTLVLAQPRLGAAGTTTHLVIVLDDSASMQSVGENEKSFRELAIEQLEQRFSELDEDAVTTIILTGPRPVMLAGPAIPWQKAKQKLQDWKPSAPRHDFLPAWDLASQFADTTGQLLFLTDQLPDETVAIPKLMEVVSVGSQIDNVAFTAARWSLEPVGDSKSGEVVGYRGRIFLRVHNYGSQTANIVVTGERTGLGEDASETQNVFQKDLKLPPMKADSISVIVPGGVGVIDVKLMSDSDGLALDSNIRLQEPSVKRVKVALTLPKESVAFRQVEKVLKIIPYIQRTSPESAHLIIGPAGVFPPSREGLWWLGIGPINRSEAARKSAIVPSDQYSYLIEKRHRLVEGMTLDGVKWGGVQPLKLEGTALIAAGPHNLLLQLRGTRSTAYLMNIDLANSTLTKSGDWPVFMQNLIEMRWEELPGMVRWNYRIGEEVRFRTHEKDNEQPKALTLTKGETSRPLISGRVVHLPVIDESGVYEIRDGDDTLEQFAVNFLDQKESSLLQCKPGKRLPITEAPSNGFQLDEPHSWLILAAMAAVIALLLANWWTLQSNRKSRSSN
jgi:Ca-activated chloride channel homolog